MKKSKLSSSLENFSKKSINRKAAYQLKGGKATAYISDMIVAG